MAKDKVFERVRKMLTGDDFLAEPDQVTPNASLVHDLGMDELDIVQLAMALEDCFTVDEVTDAEAESLQQATVAQVVDLVKAKLAKKGKASA